jgi:hypothetical protein
MVIISIHSAQQLLQLVLVHPPQLEEAVPPPVELLPVRKSDNTFPASFPHDGHCILVTELLHSSSILLLHSEQKNSYKGKTAPPLID